MKLESNELYELIRHFDDFIEVPLSIAHNDSSKYQSSFDGIKEIIKKYNQTSNDQKERPKHLTALSTHLLRLVDEMLEDKNKIKYQHTLEIKKKNYIIDGLKKYIASKEDLDAEIPSDDGDDEPPSDEKPTGDTDGLSKKELDLIKKYQ